MNWRHGTLTESERDAIITSLVEGVGARATAKCLGISPGKVGHIKNRLGLVKHTGPRIRREVPCPGCGGMNAEAVEAKT